MQTAVKKRRAKKERTRRYRQLRENGICTKCGQNRSAPEKLSCDDCMIRSIWTTAKTEAIRKGHEPINIAKDEFILWYKERREKAKGQCEWCGSSFGRLGPVADHDHRTGEPRAIVCHACNLVEGFGIDRLKKVIAAIESWNQRKILPLNILDNQQFPVGLMARSFPRWAKAVHKEKRSRDKALLKVVKEIKLRCHFEDVTSCYKNFLIFLESYEKNCTCLH